MKNKVIFLATIQFLISMHVFSQTITIDKSQDYSSFFVKEPTKSLDKSFILVTYRMEILHDTLKSGAIKSTNIMMLEIGTKHDKYFDLHKAKYKEFLAAKENKKRDPNTVISEAMQLGKGTLNEEIYWNYPNARQLTVVDHMLGNHYLYQESTPQIKWKIEAGTEEVADYMCKKAVCNLFGRNYIVWYTLDIPIGKGPWKFSGLPGLILKVTDVHNQVSWTCIGLEKKEKDIFFTERDYIKTDKSKFLKSFSDYKRNPAAMMQSAGMIQSDKVKKTRAYNPVERE
jgi:GLPGLI family protein